MSRNIAEDKTVQWEVSGCAPRSLNRCTTISSKSSTSETPCACHNRAHLRDDIRWTDDDGVTTGRDALDAKAAELQAKLGDLQFIAAGPVYQTLGLGYLAFQLVKPGSSAPVGSGFDVAIVRDGVIVEFYTVLTDNAS